MRKNSKVIIFILVFFISIGFAYLSTNLYISGTSLVKRTTWDVHFSNIQNETTTGSIDSNATISSDGKSVDFELSFEKPGDTYSFNVDVVNNGNLDAMLESFSISGLRDDASYLDWYVMYDDGIQFQKFDLLKANSTEKLYILVTFDEDVQIENLPTEDDERYTMKFTANYVQADNNGKVRESRTYNIRYNLDGGTISNNPTTYNSRLGATIPNPTKEGYTFLGWRGGKNLFWSNDLSGLSCGISFERQDDGGIHFYGTATATWSNITGTGGHLLTPGTYTMSTPEVNDYSTNIKGTYTDSSIREWGVPYNRDSRTFTVADNFRYYVYIGSLRTNDYYDSISYLQIEEGSNATGYEPYIFEPIKDIVLSPGTTGNRTYKAVWQAE